MEATDYVKDHYDNYNEDARLGCRHGQVEFLTTVRYVEKYLAPRARVLEIGAGTGRYSHYFARNGYTVDAVELVPRNIEIFRANTRPVERVTITEGNACDLSFLTAECYDITLLLGPMYHLFTEADKLAALSEAIRVTRRGGVIFAAYCNNDATIVQFGFMKNNIKTHVNAGLIDPVTFKCASVPSMVFELYCKEEIDALMSNFPVQRLHYIGTDMATNFMREAINAMDDETFELYLRYHFSVCERPEMVGATHHMLDIFRKV